MSKKTTVWLFATALVLLGYILLFERVSPRAQSQVDAQLLFPTFEAEEAMALEVRRTNQTVRVEKIGDSWKLAASGYPARETPIEELLERIQQLQQHGFISPKEFMSQPGGLSSYGLDPADVVISVVSGTNRLDLKIGDKTPVHDQVYVQPIGAAGLYLVNGDFLSHLPRTGYDWQDRSLLHLNGSFNRVEVRTGGRSYELERNIEEESWVIAKPLPARADSHRVNQLLQQIRVARVNDFVPANPAVDLERYGLRSPELELAFMNGTNPVARLLFGKAATEDPSSVYALQTQFTNVVLADKQLLDLLRLPYTAFRDRHLVRFDPRSVHELEVRAHEPFTIQKNTNGQWTVINPSTFLADPIIMDSFLTQLTQLEIVEFTKDVVTDFAEYGLNEPSMSYLLNRAPPGGVGVGTNALIAQLDFGKIQEGKIFARRADENSVYAVRYGDVLMLPTRSFQVRHRQIWSVPESDIVSVTVQKGSTSKEFKRDANRAWHSDTVVAAGMQEGLHRLGQLTAISWVEKGADKLQAYGIDDSSTGLTLEWRQNAELKRVSVKFGKLSPQGNVYAATVLPEDEQPVIFEFPALLYQLVLEHFIMAAPGNAQG